MHLLTRLFISRPRLVAFGSAKRIKAEGAVQSADTISLEADQRPKTVSGISRPNYPRCGPRAAQINTAIRLHVSEIEARPLLCYGF